MNLSIAQPQIQEQIVEVVMVIVGVPVLRLRKKSLRCFSGFATRDWTVVAQRYDSFSVSQPCLFFMNLWCERWNLEHVVLDLLSIFLYG